MSTRRSRVPPENRRRAASREAILDTAATVFARDGFHGATLDAIAGEAGLTKGAIYSSFDGKHDLFAALQERRFGNLDEQAAAAREETTKGMTVGAAAAAHLPLDRTWNLLFLEFVGYAVRHPTHRRSLIDRLRRRRRAHADELAELAAHHGVDLALPPERLARLIGALANGLALEGLLEPRADVQALLADGLNTIWRGAQTDADGASGS